MKKILCFADFSAWKCRIRDYSVKYDYCCQMFFGHLFSAEDSKAKAADIDTQLLFISRIT